jgi:hypothetical protein
MVIRVKDSGGTLRTISRIRVKDDTGAVRTISRIRVMDSSGVLRTVYNNFSASVSPTSINQVGTTSVQTSGTLTVSVSGGTAPFTYSWTLLSQVGGTFTATNPTGSSTQITAAGLFAGDFGTCTARCTISDSGGSTQVLDVPVSFFRFDDGDPLYGPP